MKAENNHVDLSLILHEFFTYNLIFIGFSEEHLTHAYVRTGGGVFVFKVSRKRPTPKSASKGRIKSSVSRTDKLNHLILNELQCITSSASHHIYH